MNQSASHTDPAPSPHRVKAGRNLPWAITVGGALAGLIIVCLWLSPWTFYALTLIAVCIGINELLGALTQAGYRVRPVLVLTLAALIITGAFLGGSQGLIAMTAVSCGFLASLRHADEHPPGGNYVVQVFVLVYVAVLGGTATMLVMEPDGAWKVAFCILVSAGSDIGGYFCGVLWGKHPMAPQVSPKKSWEGFAGSLTVCAVVGAVALPLMMGHAWWAGALYGVAAGALATTGDLIESLLKRDLGIKDLGSLLPGHGGLMDRLDSILLTVPAAWLFFSVLG